MATVARLPPPIDWQHWRLAPNALGVDARGDIYVGIEPTETGAVAFDDYGTWSFSYTQLKSWLSPLVLEGLLTRSDVAVLQALSAAEADQRKKRIRELNRQRYDKHGFARAVLGADYTEALELLQEWRTIAITMSPRNVPDSTGRVPRYTRALEDLRAAQSYGETNDDGPSLTAIAAWLHITDMPWHTITFESLAARITHMNAEAVRNYAAFLEVSRKIVKNSCVMNALRPDERVDFYDACTQLRVNQQQVLQRLTASVQ